MPNQIVRGHIRYRRRATREWEAIHPITFEPIMIQHVPYHGWIVIIGDTHILKPFRTKTSAMDHVTSLLPSDYPIWIKINDHDYESHDRRWSITRSNTRRKTFILSRKSQRIFAYHSSTEARGAAERLSSLHMYHDTPPFTFPLTPSESSRLLQLPHPHGGPGLVIRQRNTAKDQ